MNHGRDDFRLYNDGWSFKKTGLGVSLEEALKETEDFKPVEIPHDWLIYDAENLYEDSYGWYRKVMAKPAGEIRHVQLYFEGVYMDSTLYVNRKKVGDWKYGYSSFVMDITDFLTEEENEILMLVRHQSPNSRWYSGAGIYRDVWVKYCKEAYLPINGTYVHIEKEQDDCFVVEADTRVAGMALKNMRITYELWREGQREEVLGSVDGENEALREEMVSFRTKVKSPLLWSIEDPVCYSLRVILENKGTEVGQNPVVMDVQEMTIGFRTVQFDPDEGFSLNGKKIKIQGVCEHHDLGCLGSAFHKEALRRKFKILKEMGVNGLRTSHNMPAKAFMDLADEMGFVVMTEAFDMWERCKTEYDYGRFFVDWAERDVKSWVTRDCNHPSLILWSIGNEIYDTHADAHGEEITKRLMGYVRKYDPKKNAPITIASNYMPWEGAQHCADLVKLAGYNYGEKCYEEHHKKHPDWIIYGSETASVVASRGIYHFPLSQSILADEDEQCSALGNSSTSWGADSIEQCIQNDERAEFSFGQFLWTGFDYIGEPTPYHTKNSYFGQIDTAGFPKDSFYVLKAQWTDVNTHPMVHLFPYWDFNPGQLIDLRATSNADVVELFVNGRSMGKQELIHEKAEKLLVDWQVPYEPGEVVAVAYDNQGHEIARDVHHSFGDSRRIVLSVDQEYLKADSEDLCFVTIETVDENGYPVENAADYVSVEVSGPGRLLGMDNGDSTDTDSYKGNVRKLFVGRLLAVIGTTGQPGTIEVKVSGAGLESATVNICSTAGEAVQKTVLDACKECKEHHTVPVRKVELTNLGVSTLTKENSETIIRATIYPKLADAELIWKIVNDSGIDINVAKIEKISRQDVEGEKDPNVSYVKVKAAGDGAFRIRVMAKEPSGKITVISQLECAATGMGIVNINPYELVVGGLLSGSQGEMGNGNEKGISTSRDTDSAFWYDSVDFGDFGSDKLTMPIFALDDAEYLIDVWKGVPHAEGSVMIDTIRYQKPSIWNTYQEETWTLKERLSKVSTIGFETHKQKLHFKGFSFEMQIKAFAKIYAGWCDRVYGDSFLRTGDYVEGIGNNVTFEYSKMDFGAQGATHLVICGKSDLQNNTIHIRFTPTGGETVNRMVEFTKESEYKEQSFEIEKLCGEGRIDLIFLPGSQFDLAYFRFYE